MNILRIAGGVNIPLPGMNAPPSVQDVNELKADFTAQVSTNGKSLKITITQTNTKVVLGSSEDIESKESNTITVVTAHKLDSKGNFDLVPNSMKISTSHSNDPQLSHRLKERVDYSKEMNEEAKEAAKEEMSKPEKENKIFEDDKQE